MRRPLFVGELLALATGVVWAVLSAVLGFHLGLLVLAAFGGWLIGSALKPIGPRAAVFSVVFAAEAWLVGSVLDFILSQVLLPDAATPVGERLAAPRYFDFLAGTFDIIQALAIAILLIVAWRSAR